jgi:hypothetical protein
MRRSVIVLLILALLVTWAGFAAAGGRHYGYGSSRHYGGYGGYRGYGHHHHHNGALWWGLGLGAGLGILGTLAARPYYSAPPAYPFYAPVMVPQPYRAMWYYCPAYQAYYPYVPSCPMPWVQVQVP